MPIQLSLAAPTVFNNLRVVFFDFDGVFTDNFVYVDQDGRESVRCSRLDGIGLDLLRALDLRLLIVSTETNDVVKKELRN